MNERLNNEAWIEEFPGGLYGFHAFVWTKMANIKRQKVFVELAINQLAALEHLIQEMDYDKIERLEIDLTPIDGTNGHSRQAETQESAGESGNETPQIKEGHQR